MLNSLQICAFEDFYDAGQRFIIGLVGQGSDLVPKCLSGHLTCARR